MKYIQPLFITIEVLLLLVLTIICFIPFMIIWKIINHLSTITHESVSEFQPGADSLN
jgi:hypothetical protein